VAGALGDWAVLGASRSARDHDFLVCRADNAINLIDASTASRRAESAVSAVVIVMISTAINHPPPFAVALAGG
jgi:hypothetical protein